MKIWLDDKDTGNRATPPGYTHIYNFSGLSELLDRTSEPIEIMDFDNDLGEKVEGHHILVWLFNERRERYPQEVRIHSSNPPARKKMEEFDRWARRMIAKHGSVNTSQYSYESWWTKFPQK